ncbi:MAG: type II secretion system F family protein [Clostridia bacterium]|nr:type II secretion system F family protein [Clostridia bacterium]
MAFFLYKARDKEGNLIEGKIETDLLIDAVRKLQQSGLFVIDIKQQKQGTIVEKMLGILFSPRVKLKDLAIFCRQLSFMLEAGLSLEYALQVNMYNQTSLSVKKLSQILLKELREGRSFGDACAQLSREIPPIMRDLVLTAEVGGFLDSVLARLAEYFEKETESREKVKTALVYPALVMVIALLALCVIFTFVVPVFAGILEDLNAPLPMGTKIVLKISLIFNRYWYLLLLGLFFLASILILYLRSFQGKKRLDELLLKLPFLKELNQKVIASRFCRTLANLLQSGVPLYEALKVVELTIGNLAWQGEIEKTRENIKNGKSLTESFKKNDFFPPMMVQMIAVGEQSGTIDSLLLKVGSYYDNEVVETAERLPKLIEPIILVLLGIIVGLVVLGVLIPMFSVIGGIN